MTSVEQSYAMFPRSTEETDFMLYPEPQSQTGYASPPMEAHHQYGPEAFYPRHAHDVYLQTSNYDVNAPVYPDAPPHYMFNGRASPGAYPEDAELQPPPSARSTASGPSATSSTVGSPHSNQGQLAFIPEYQQHVAVNPGIVGHGDYYTGTEYSFPAAMDEFNNMAAYGDKPGFVDPSLIHPEIRGPMGPPMQNYEQQQPVYSPQNPYPNSPTLSAGASPIPGARNDSTSPYVANYQYSPFAVPTQARRPSLPSYQSPDYPYSGDDSKEKQRCPQPDCGKQFKDLKAHMLTHQTERPEKCPIGTCEYHVKGFARKYDKNRHTLTHYKGTMVCGFCPGSGSTVEKSFNRADVFKRHLTAVHGVEQTPPNSRKKSAAAAANSGKKLSGYAPDATGKCSTCTATFSNAQDFYEHLDDCVLRIVQQEDPAEAINAKRLAEVAADEDVIATLEKNNLPLTTPTTCAAEEDVDDAMDDEVLLPQEDDYRVVGKKGQTSPTKTKGNPANGVQKSRGMTHSRGGVPSAMATAAAATKAKGRKNRREYPSSWGFDKGQMTTRKRVLAVFDGPRRLAKDDMQLSTEQEVRVRLADGKSYCTDLDVHCMKRAQGFLDASEAEKGAWVADDPTEAQMAQMQQMAGWQ